jgi:ribosomal protein S18 acetylase RimI-like enzyme
MDGPRACRVDELPALRRLENSVFRADGGDMFDQYPHVYGEHNVENLRIVADGERVVSCVGMIERWASISHGDVILSSAKQNEGSPRGHPAAASISCALIGGVATDPDYRSRGLATACLHDALAEARADGVDLAFISGGRGMYLRAGARSVGREWRATVEAAAADRCADPSLSVTDWEPDREMADVADVYNREPVRWLRPLDDFRHFARSGCVIDWPCTISVVRRGGAVGAYLLVSAADENGRSYLFEYAGERELVTGALAAAMRARGARSLAIDVLDGDAALRQRLAAAGIELTPAAPDHTVLIVNFPSLMERLRSPRDDVIPRVAQRHEESRHGHPDRMRDSSGRFAFREEPDEDGELRVCVIERDGEEMIRLDRADMVRAIFGDASEDAASPPADLSELFPSGPVPLPQYGLNYV